MKKPQTFWADVPQKQFVCLLERIRGIAPATRYNKTPLWVLVSEVTGHGSGVSADLCRWFDLDPHLILHKTRRL